MSLEILDHRSAFRSPEWSAEVRGQSLESAFLQSIFHLKMIKENHDLFKIL